MRKIAKFLILLVAMTLLTLSTPTVWASENEACEGVDVRSTTQVEEAGTCGQSGDPTGMGTGNGLTDDEPDLDSRQTGVDWAGVVDVDDFDYLLYLALLMQLMGL